MFTFARLNRLSVASTSAAGLVGLTFTVGPPSAAYAETLPWLTESSRYESSTTYPYDEPYDYGGRYGSESRYGAEDRYDAGTGYYDEQRRTQQSYTSRADYSAPSDIQQGTCNRSRLPLGLNTQTIGGALGGVIGGLIGSRVGEGRGKTVATIAGALAGIAAGSYLGKTMDAGDQYCAGQTLEFAQDNRSVQWNNPDNNSSYVVTPVKTYEEGGRHCRKYTTKVTAEGETKKVTGTACRQPDGTWKIVE